MQALTMQLIFVLKLKGHRPFQEFCRFPRSDAGMRDGVEKACQSKRESGICIKENLGIRRNKLDIPGSVLLASPQNLIIKLKISGHLQEGFRHKL